MEYNIPVKNSIFPNISALWINCSSDTKNAINSFFERNMNFEHEIVPVITSVGHPFSIYKYDKSNRNICMITLNRTGIKHICAICEGSKSEKETSRRLLKYFKNVLNGKYSDEIPNIKKLIPFIANHYIRYKDRQCYDIEKSLGRYQCFIYPLDYTLIRGLMKILGDISATREDVIMKEQFCI